MLKFILAQKMKELELGSRRVAEETEVSHTTILRVPRGETVDLETVLKLSNWLGMRPSSLLNSMSEQSTLSDRVTALIEAHPSLASVFEKAIDSINAGKASPAIIDDIVAYAVYKLDRIGVVDANTANSPGGSKS